MITYGETASGIKAPAVARNRISAFICEALDARAVKKREHGGLLSDSVDVRVARVPRNDEQSISRKYLICRKATIEFLFCKDRLCNGHCVVKSLII